MNRFQPIASRTTTNSPRWVPDRVEMWSIRRIQSNESPKTTKLYDRTDDQITLDEVENINLNVSYLELKDESPFGRLSLWHYRPNI